MEPVETPLLELRFCLPLMVEVVVEVDRFQHLLLVAEEGVVLQAQELQQQQQRQVQPEHQQALFPTSAEWERRALSRQLPHITPNLEGVEAAEAPQPIRPYLLLVGVPYVAEAAEELAAIIEPVQQLQGVQLVDYQTLMSRAVGRLKV